MNSLKFTIKYKLELLTSFKGSEQEPFKNVKTYI